MIDDNAIEAARTYLKENDPEGLMDHMNDIGFDVNPTKLKIIMREILKEDGYTEDEIKRALDVFEELL